MPENIFPGFFSSPAYRQSAVMHGRQVSVSFLSLPDPFPGCLKNPCQTHPLKQIEDGTQYSFPF